ncbi:hypothetical protein B0H10DRAFT_2244124 [Mycena sp. CBHHK59/15]|nr:hypothetical protein B0H10DRAFT_2244124 [Mycena sp. CBHHK59/15]
MDKTLPAPIARGANRPAHRGPRDVSDSDEGGLTAWTTALFQERRLQAKQRLFSRSCPYELDGVERLSRQRNVVNTGAGRTTRTDLSMQGWATQLFVQTAAAADPAPACRPRRARTMTAWHALGPPRSPRATLWGAQRYYLALPVITPNGGSKDLYCTLYVTMRSVWTRHPSTPGPLGWLVGRWMSPSPPHPPVFPSNPCRVLVCTALDAVRSHSAPVLGICPLTIRGTHCPPTSTSLPRSSRPYPAAAARFLLPVTCDEGPMHALDVDAILLRAQQPIQARVPWLVGRWTSRPRRPLLYSLLKFVPSSVPLWIPHSAHRRLDLSVSGLPPPSSAHVARWYMRATPLSPPLHRCGGTPLMRWPPPARFSRPGALHEAAATHSDALPPPTTRTTSGAIAWRGHTGCMKQVALTQRCRDGLTCPMSSRTPLAMRRYPPRPPRLLMSATHRSMRLPPYSGWTHFSAPSSGLPPASPPPARRGGYAWIASSLMWMLTVRTVSARPTRSRCTAPPTTRKTNGVSIARVALAGPH